LPKSWQAKEVAPSRKILRLGEGIVLTQKWGSDVGSSHPGGGEAPKGKAKPSPCKTGL